MIRNTLSAAALVALGVGANAAPITPTFTTFGDINAAFDNTVTFGGSGIPTSPGSITEFGIPGTDTILRLGIMATPRFTSPTPANDGAGTYTVQPGESVSSTGLVGSKWNFSFAAELDGPNSFTLSDVSLKLFYDLDPGFGTDDSAMGMIDFGNTVFGGATFIEGSQNAAFGIFNTPILPSVSLPAFTPFSSFAPGEYSFALRADVNGQTSEASMNVSVVPLPASALFLLSALAGAAALRRRKAS